MAGATTDTYPFIPVGLSWWWDDSSDRSAATITFEYTRACNITLATGSFSALAGKHTAGQRFDLTCNGGFGAPSSGSSGVISGALRWEAV